MTQDKGEKLIVEFPCGRAYAQARDNLGFVLFTLAVIVVLVNWLIMQTGQSLAEQQLTALLAYWWLRDLPFCALFYGLILGIGSALDYYRQFRGG